VRIALKALVSPKLPLTTRRAAMNATL